METEIQRYVGLSTFNREFATNPAKVSGEKLNIYCYVSESDEADSRCHFTDCSKVTKQSEQPRLVEDPTTRITESCFRYRYDTLPGLGQPRQTTKLGLTDHNEQNCKKSSLSSLLRSSSAFL